MIYFLNSISENKIKIGHSIDPCKRIAHLETSHPSPLNLLLVIPGGIKREMEIQKNFADLRVRGEWFESTPGLLEFIEKSKSGEFRVCRVCGLTYLSKPDKSDIKEHSKNHRSIMQGVFPYSIRELLKGIAHSMLANKGEKIEISSSYDKEDIKRFVAYSWWFRAKQQGIKSIHFEDFLIDCMEYLDCSWSSDLSDLKAVDKRLNVHWGDFWPLDSEK